MPTVDPGFPQEGPELREHGDHRSNLPSMADWNWNLWVPCTACLLQCQCTVFDRCVNFTHSLRKPSFDKFCHNLAQDAVKAELQRTNGDVTKGRDLAVARLVETYQCQWFFLVETHRELMIHFFNLFFYLFENLNCSQGLKYTSLIFVLLRMPWSSPLRMPLMMLMKAQT